MRRPPKTKQAALELDEASADLKDSEPTSIEELRERGAATPDAENANKRAKATKSRKQKGDKSVLWGQHEDVLYELIMDAFGNEQVMVRVKRTAPEPHDFGRQSHTVLRSYKLLMDYIDDVCWDGSKSTFFWEAFGHGWQRLGGDFIYKGESELQRARFLARNRAAAQEMLGGQLQQQQQQVPASPAAPAAPSLDSAVLNSIVAKLDAMNERIDDIEDNDSDDVPLQQLHVQSIPPPQAPAPEPTMPQYEQVVFPDGSVGWKPKVVAVPPPAHLPAPPQGCAWQQTNGEWRCVFTNAPASAPAAPAPVAPAAIAPGIPPQEREMLERAHTLETELAVIKATQKVLNDQRKTEDGNGASHAQPQMLQPPAGYQWAQDPSGKWQAVPLAQAESPRAPSNVSSFSALAKEAIEVQGTLQKVATAFSGGGMFPKVGEAAATAAATAAEKPSIPLEPLNVGGGVNLWWNHQDKKFVEPSMQAVMNIPVAMEGLKSFGKDLLGGIREMRNDERRQQEERFERNKREAQAKMQQQQQVIQRQNEQLRRMQQGAQQVVEIEPEPEPDPPPAPEPQESITAIARSVLG